MKKWALLLTIAALVCWLPGQALAIGYLDKFESPLNSLGGNQTGFPVEANYGKVTVYWFSTTSANVVFDLVDSPDFDFLSSTASAWLNVSGTATAALPPGWTVPANLSPDISGTFDVGARTNTANLDTLNIGLTATGATTWATAASVLEFNAAGFDAAVRVVADGTDNDGAGPSGYVGEPVPLPGAILLLGAGLGRLAVYARRKRQV